MPKTEAFAVPDRPLMERAFKETILPAFNRALAPKGFRLLDYLSSEVLGEERAQEVLSLVMQSNREHSNACLTDDALVGVVRMNGFG
ncbi:MAG: hypothetical protein HYW90_01570 [Candidatus Sungbacteria bacterium]|nr:hypothetical protein [Candidatus Sungbacteria bacterium]